MRWLLSVILLLMSCYVQAAVFVVTSNAGDYSPGTFKEALDKAQNNGTAITDTILFNLPNDIESRTIRGDSYNLSSNLIIDGASQIGSPFGVSDAKIHILPPGDYCPSGFLLYHVSHVEIYGLWLSDYISSSLDPSCLSSAIKVRDVSYLTIGKPGKGNVFSNSTQILLNDWLLEPDSTDCNNVLLQSNFFGMDPWGFLSTNQSISISFGRAKNILLGGTDTREGNLFGVCLISIGNPYNQPATGNGFITVMNNTFGLDYSQQHYSSKSSLSILGNYLNNSDFNITIQKNTFAHDTVRGSIALTNIQNVVTITDNEIGALDDGTFGSDGDALGIGLLNCSLPNKTLIYHNTIHGYLYGIAVTDGTGITISQNSIYCNQTGIYTYNSQFVQTPQVLIKSTANHSVTGTACPSCKLEFFTTAQCPDLCQNGQQYIGETTADNTGNFAYTTASTEQISATATNAEGTTSAFDGPRFTNYDRTVTNASCGNANGSITGITVSPAGTPVHWEDSSGKVIANSLDLLNVPTGFYRAYIENPLRGCKIYFANVFVDSEGAPQVDASQFAIQSSRCSKANGSVIFTGWHPSNHSFTWLNAAKKVITIGTDSLLNLNTGTYYCRLISNNDNSCYTEYGPFEIINQTDTCTNVKITGPVKVCFFSDTSLYFTGTRNAGCTLPVHWSEAALPGTVSEVNDSIALYHFADKGTTKVFAHIEGYCKEFEDSLTVQLYQGAEDVNLGLDKTICPDSQVILSAPDNMASYLWQNKAATQTFTANKPGTYYVAATDYCGRISSDTLLLSAPSITSLNLQPQYTKCNGDTVTVALSGTASDFAFSPATNIIAINSILLAWPSSNIQYTIGSTTTEGCGIEDQLNVQVYKSASLSLGADTSVCEGSSITLKVPSGFTNELWNNGSTTASVTVSDAGDYSVVATDVNQCKAGDTLQLFVRPKPSVSLGKDKPICQGQNIMLDAGGQNQSYLWQDSSVNETYIVNQPGLYWVAVENANNCTVSDTVKITGYAAIPSHFLKETDSICTNQDKLLTANGEWASYRWSTGSTQPAITVRQEGYYWLTVQSNEGCSAIDTIHVVQKDCLLEIYFPSAFTPNGDGKNDVFKPITGASVENYSLTIYNRFGHQVFLTNDPIRGWNGWDKNTSLNSGVYVWICKYQLQGQIAKAVKGTVVLMK